MSFDHHRYVPCLRWKQGEYQAMLRLSEPAKDFITPLIEVPEIGFDFAKGRPSKTVDDHLEPFAKRVTKKMAKPSMLRGFNAYSLFGSNGGWYAPSKIYLRWAKISRL